MNNITIIGIAVLVMLSGFGVKAEPKSTENYAALQACTSISIRYIENSILNIGDIDDLSHLTKEDATQRALKVLSQPGVTTELTQSDSGTCTLEVHYELAAQVQHLLEAPESTLIDTLRPIHRARVEVHV